MIHSKTNSYNQIHSIIKDYMENNRFSIGYEYLEIKKEIEYSHKKTNSLLLIVILDNNKLKLINQDKLDESNYVNIIILGEYSYTDFITDFGYRDCFLKNNKIKKFIKSDIFKNRILKIFSEYNIKKLNGECNKIDALFKFKIPINDATIEQKIYCYLETNCEYVKKTIYLSINFELLNKSEFSKIQIRENTLKFFYENNRFSFSNYNSYKNYYKLNKILMSCFFEKTNNELDILLDTLVNYFKILYNKNLGEINKNYLNKKLDIQHYDYNFEAYVMGIFEDIFSNDNFNQWMSNSKFTDINKRDLLRVIGSTGIYFLINSNNNNILTLLDFLNNDYIYTLKFNNKNLIMLTKISKFYVDSFFEEIDLGDDNLNSSLNLIQIPEYVKELYISKDEYMKFKTYCTLFNKDEKSVIPKTTKIIFVEDVSDKNFENRLV